MPRVKMVGVPFTHPWQPGSGPYRVARLGQHLDHTPVPCGVVGFGPVVDPFFKEPDQLSVL